LKQFGQGIYLHCAWVCDLFSEIFCVRIDTVQICSTRKTSRKVTASQRPHIADLAKKTKHGTSPVNRLIGMNPYMSPDCDPDRSQKLRASSLFRWPFQLENFLGDSTTFYPLHSDRRSTRCRCFVAFHPSVQSFIYTVSQE